MHKHPRARIRHRVAEFLKGKIDINTERIYVNRPDTYMLEELPCACVYFKSEAVEEEDTAPQKDKRTLSLVVEVIYKAGVEQFELDDWMDDRAYEVEDALLLPKLDAWDYREEEQLIDSIQLTGTIPYTVTIDGAKKGEATKISFDIVYYREIVEGGNLDEFLRFENKIEATNGAESDDLVTIREE